MNKIEISKKVFNKAYIPYLDCNERFLIFYGGSGSGKSHFVVQRYIYKILKEKKLNLLVIRKTGKTNRTSTFALFNQIINSWGLRKIFTFNQSDLRIRCINGNEIVFSGLDDVEKLKSITFKTGELTDIWIEEASEVDINDFRQLNIRLRGGKTTKQMVLSFNPIDINHWIKKELIDTNKAVVLKTTYKDNAFIDEAYKKELEDFKNTDPYYYTVYCLGEWGVYGKSIFNSLKISERLNNLTGEVKQGGFIYKDNGLKIYDYYFSDSFDYIKIYNERIKGVPYVIGADTAGEGSDYFAAQVIDNITGKQVAVLHSKFDEDEFARQIYCLGKYYNDALIAVEANFSTFPIKELERLGYENQYIRKREDTFTGKSKKSYGVVTDRKSRSIMIGEIVKYARDNIDYINDKKTLEEMLTFVRNEKGRAEAKAGTHDDLVMSLAIALYIRDSQDNKMPEMYEKKIYNFEFEKPGKNKLGKDDCVIVL